MAATKALSKQKQGVTYVTHTGTYNSPELCAETIADYSQTNIFYNKVKNSQRHLIFPKPPEITVTDVDGEVDEELSARLKQISSSKEVNLWAQMQTAWGDVFDYGASLKNPVWGYQGNEYLLKELRHLPAQSFGTIPTADLLVAGEILEGIGVDRITGELRYFQEDYNGQTKEVRNVFMVKDPLSQHVAGTPISYPILPILGAIKFSLNAQMQKVNRIGAPVPWVKINEPQPANQQNGYVSDEEYAQMFLQNASKDVSMPLRDNMELVDPYQGESGSAMETLEFLNKLVADYWSPSSLISKDGTLLGGSSASEMGLLMRYVSSVHEWLENAFEELLQPYLDANGYEGYSIDIEIPEPEIDTSELDRQRAETAGQNCPGGIRANEFRAWLGLPEDENLEGMYLSDLQPQQAQGMSALMNTDEKPTPRQAEKMSEKEQKDIWREVAEDILEAVEVEYR
jgi:hypothetical protein